MKGKKILVTGGTGFIGSHTVVELAAAGFQPVLMDNFDNSQASVLDGLETILGFRPAFYEADCNDAAAFTEIFQKESNIGGVIHFAAHKAVGESVQLPIKYYRNNIGSLLSLLETAKAAGILPRGVFSFSGKTHPYALHRYDPDFDRDCANCLG